MKVETMTDVPVFKPRYVYRRLTAALALSLLLIAGAWAQEAAAPAQAAKVAPPAAAPENPAAATPAEMPEVLYESGGEALATAAPAQEKITIIAKQYDLDRIFGTIREKTGVQVKAMGAIKGVKIDLTAQDKTVEEILDQISLAPNNWIWRKIEDGSYEVYDKDSYIKIVQAGQVIRTTFQLKFIDAEEFDAIIKPVLTPNLGASSADARTNKLIITDLPDKIALIQSIIREYDIQLYTRPFEIRFGDTDEIADRLEDIKSKAAEIIVDPVNRLIIAKDTFEKIKEMEQIVELLDRDQEIRVYNLANIGYENELAEELIDLFIEPLLTDDAVINYSTATSKLFIKDVHSVQEQVLDVLRQLDQPRKQVLIEGEVLSVDLGTELNLGTEWTFASDLQGAIDAGTAPEGIEDAFGLPLASVGSGGFSFVDLGDKVRVAFNAAMKDDNTNILLQPRIIIANGEEGSFDVISSEPYSQTFFYNNSSNTTNSSRGQSTIDTGLMVTITPYISNRGLVEMELHFENSSPIFVSDIDGQGTRGVGKNAQTAETYLIIPSGETRVIGGLISQEKTDSKSGVPILSQLPYLGFLFGTVTKSDSTRNLMFFITPTIIEEEPLNDLMVEPVNQVARASMRNLMETPIPPAGASDIPEELQPMLEELRPKPLPMSGETTTGDVDVLPEGSAVGIALLSDEAYVDPKAVGKEKVGGAVHTLGGGVGPSGVFGGKERPVIRRRDRTEPTQPDEAAPAQPTQPQEQPPAVPAQPGQAEETPEEQPPAEQAPEEVAPPTITTSPDIGQLQ